MSDGVVVTGKETGAPTDSQNVTGELYVLREPQWARENVIGASLFYWGNKIAKIESKIYKTERCCSQLQLISGSVFSLKLELMVCWHMFYKCIAWECNVLRVSCMPFRLQHWMQDGSESAFGAHRIIINISLATGSNWFIRLNFLLPYCSKTAAYFRAGRLQSALLQGSTSPPMDVLLHTQFGN